MVYEVKDSLVEIHHKLYYQTFNSEAFRRKAMASNFQIYSYKTRDSLHLKLNGDFDGNSAYELINILDEAGTGVWEIFIDTNGLKTVHPFGRTVFEKSFSILNKKLSNLIFIGEKEHQLAQY